eukprot:251048_1
MDPSLHPTDGDPFVVLRSMVTMDAMDYNAVLFEINGDDECIHRVATCHGDPFVILRSMVTMDAMDYNAVFFEINGDDLFEINGDDECIHRVATCHGDPFVILRSMVTMDAMDYTAVFFEINGDDGDPFVILRSMVTMNPMAFACGHSKRIIKEGTTRKPTKNHQRKRMNRCSNTSKALSSPKEEPKHTQSVATKRRATVFCNVM